jgi:SAM-dependent methyltransferase
MSAFEDYAAYYDAMYADKDYAAEVSYIESLILGHAQPGTLSILDLGSETGRHAIELASRGYDVHGIDLSARMVALAEARKSSLSEDLKRKVNFSVGDVRSVRLDAQFDVVLALFHVASYQTKNADFQAFLTTALLHLRPGGILIFDFWYGPAVLSQRPEVRIKRADTESRWVVRIAEPATRFEENCVIVKYEIIDCFKKTGVTTRVIEEHKMRFFFLPDLQLFAELAGIDILSRREWLKASDPSADSWSVCVVARQKCSDGKQS